MAIISDIHQRPWSLFCHRMSVLHSVFYSKRHFLFRYFLPSSVVGGTSASWSLPCSFTGGRSGSVSLGCAGDGPQCGSQKSPLPPMLDLTHLVVVANGCFAQLPFKIQLEGKIQVPLQGGKKRGRRGQYSSSTKQTADLSCELLFIWPRSRRRCLIRTADLGARTPPSHRGEDGDRQG